MPEEQEEQEDNSDDKKRPCLSEEAIRILVEEDRCPVCLGELTGWECNECGYDAFPIGQSMGVIDEGD